MARGALGYARRLVTARQGARFGMALTIVLALVALVALVVAGWAADDAVAIAALLLLFGCGIACAVLWRMQARASRDLEEEIAALARQRRGRDGPDGRGDG